jgi:molecular chaperone HscA
VADHPASFQVCDDALAQAGLAVSQIDQVLLVGGMTRMPLVQETTSQYFGQPAVANLNPDEVVAIGAAIQAHNLTQGVTKKTSVLLDVTPQTLGIETVGGFMESLIPRNSPVPTEASKMFHLANDFQTGVRVCIYQGEDRKVGRTRSSASSSSTSCRPVSAARSRSRSRSRSTRTASCT